jgi:hypothetical protein
LNVFLTFRKAGKIIEEDFLYIAKTFIPGIVGFFWITRKDMFYEIRLHGVSRGAGNL